MLEHVPQDDDARPDTECFEMIEIRGRCLVPKHGLVQLEMCTGQFDEPARRLATLRSIPLIEQGTQQPSATGADFDYRTIEFRRPEPFTQMAHHSIQVAA
ncbi:hypothetical protein WJ69_02840 [Burkholderia ubonensis]|nr:hypothetical protein WJ69_02840 [Burkholderia ubonensis]